MMHVYLLIKSIHNYIMNCNHYMIMSLVIISAYFLFINDHKVVEGADCGKLAGTALSKCNTCIRDGFKKTDCKNQFY